MPGARTAAAAALAILAALATPVPAAAGDDARLAQFASEWSDLRQAVTRLARRVEELEAEVGTLRGRLGEMQRLQEGALRPLVIGGGRDERGPPRLAPVVFTVAADPRGGPRSASLDLEEIGRRCADAEGCLATLSVAGIVENDRTFEVALGIGPCLLHDDPESGAWSVSPACAGTDGGPLGRYGRDGGSPLSPGADRARILIDLGGACLLAEAGPTRFRKADGEAALSPSAARDLHLIATSATWHLGETFPADLLPEGTPFECRLSFRD